MTLQIIIGTQWGDEGKGRFVDLLSAQADFVARFSGGDNAGHTIRIADKVYKLHLIPSGIIYPGTIGMMGNGMAINPEVLLREMEELRQGGIAITPARLKISYMAHIITPAHRRMDKAREIKLGNAKIGTTGRGIGPAYADKARRVGLVYKDMLDPEGFEQKLRTLLAEKNESFEKIYAMEPLDVEAVVEEFRGYAKALAPYVADTSELLRTALLAGQKVIAEGAQGALLDTDFGTYPYVTSSSCLAANALLGLGIGIPKAFDIVGIAKVFQTRVGEGPFPTELFDRSAELLRGDGSQQWDEFGTTTGRPRRVGWLDAVLLKKVVEMNNISRLALTKLDVLSGFDEVKICVEYATPSALSPMVLDHAVEPAYRTFKGWEENIMQTTRWEELPVEAQEYVRFIEDYIGVPVNWISVGPERNQIILR